MECDDIHKVISQIYS